MTTAVRRWRRRHWVED